MASVNSNIFRDQRTIRTSGVTTKPDKQKKRVNTNLLVQQHVQHLQHLQWLSQLLKKGLLQTAYNLHPAHNAMIKNHKIKKKKKKIWNILIKPASE